MESPCQNQCTLDKERNMCSVCLRTLAEITMWGKMTNQQKRSVLEEVSSRRSHEQQKA
ncbi:DUF1289 domain-containing protein [Flexibacterium corallicola]|uniref:DUF1289 domain-containing protein n=1 Tax=Flexibacterium corallicola TaxID=3037259 RepID=UPI0038621C70